MHVSVCHLLQAAVALVCIRPCRGDQLLRYLPLIQILFFVLFFSYYHLVHRHILRYLQARPQSKIWFARLLIFWWYRPATALHPPMAPWLVDQQRLSLALVLEDFLHDSRYWNIFSLMFHYSSSSSSSFCYPSFLVSTWDQLPGAAHKSTALWTPSME